MISHAQKFYVWSLVILANVMLAFLMIHDLTRTINPDGVLYLQTAEAYAKYGWKGAMHLYPWPFYSVFIAWFSQLFHCSMEYAAYSINIIFQILMSVGFIKLACKTRVSAIPIELQDAKFCIGLAALTILLYPTLNSQRDLIARDFGYWAFSLWGWLYLICFMETKRYGDVCKFNVAMLLASLFRLEGVLMLLLGPLAIFGVTSLPLLRRAKLFMQAYLAPCIIFVAAAIYFASHTPQTLGRLVDFKIQLNSAISLMLEAVIQAKIAMGTEVLTPLSADGALTLLLVGLIGVYFKTLITTLTVFYSLLIGVAIRKKIFIPSPTAKPIVYTAISLNIIVTLIFLFQHLFVDRRYLFGLCLLLLLWVPSLLVWIYERTKRDRPWVFLAILSMLFVIAAVSLHNFGPSKNYLKMAGYWMHENLPPSALVYTNSPQVSFYAARPLVSWKPQSSSGEFASSVQASLLVRGYDYLAFQAGGNQVTLKSQLTQYFGQPVKIFANEKGDVVWIFPTHNTY